MVRLCTNCTTERATAHFRIGWKDSCLRSLNHSSSHRFLNQLTAMKFVSDESDMM